MKGLTSHLEAFLAAEKETVLGPSSCGAVVIEDALHSTSGVGPGQIYGSHGHNRVEDGLRIVRVRRDDPHGHNHAHNGNHKDVGHRSAHLRDYESIYGSKVPIY